MPRDREDRRERRRAGSGQRDAKHRAGGDWTTLTIPDGIDVFQPKEGSVRLDIVPYEVGEGNPYAKPGEWYYERTFYTHGRVGPNNESYVCPNKTAHKPCPICEYRAKLASDPDGDEKLIKALKPKERQLWLVYVHEKGEEGAKKVRLWESSFHTFGRLLDKLRHDADEDEVHKTDFDDPEAGATLKISFNEEDAGGYSFIDAYAVDFKPRPEGLDRELLDHGICLDRVVKVLPYDELKKLFLQEDGGGDEKEEPVPTKKTERKPPAKDDDWDEPAPAKGPKAHQVARAEPKEERAKPDEFEEGQRVRHRQFGACEVLRIGDDGALMLETSEGKVIKGVDRKNVRPLQEEPKPKPKPAPVAKDEDDWDDEPVPQKKQERKAPAPAKAAAKVEDDDWD